MGDGRDNYLLTIHTHEHEVSVHGRPWVKVAAGDVMIINEGVESRFRLPETVVNVVSLGRADLARLVPFIDREPAYNISRNVPGVALMAGYADLLRRSPPRGERAEAMAANHLYDLVALTLDGIAKGGASRNDRSIRAARLELVKRDVLDRRRNPDLTVEAIARRQGVTVRYIHRLFEAEGVTFSEFLRDNRLELAYRALRMTPSSATIASIAFDVGFCDLSSFNRAFRRRYGATPSEVRSQGMRER
jgi:AraC-like DNA-binding protein